MFFHHPRKLEVRFGEEEQVRTTIRDAIESTLLDAGLIRSGAPRGRSAPEQTEISPAGGAEETASPETPTESTPPADRSTEADSIDGRPTPVDQEQDSSATVRDQSTRQTSASTIDTPATSTASSAAETSTDADTGTVSPPDDEEVTPIEQSASVGTKNREREATTATGSKFGERGMQARLSGSPVGTEQIEFDSLPPLRIMGQFDETYLVAETDTGLVLIDQHAADERINYERLRDEVTGETTTQALADPVTVELTAREAELFEHNTDALARIGITATRVANREVEVRALPALVAEQAGPELVRDVLGEFVQGETAALETVDAVVEALLADLACYPSITGNTSLSEGSVIDLLETLDDCENPYACPHGRPVIIEFDTEEIEDRFERDYPGHT